MAQCENPPLGDSGLAQPQQSNNAGRTLPSRLAWQHLGGRHALTGAVETAEAGTRPPAPRSGCAQRRRCGIGSGRKTGPSADRRGEPDRRARRRPPLPPPHASSSLSSPPSPSLSSWLLLLLLARPPRRDRSVLLAGARSGEPSNSSSLLLRRSPKRRGRRRGDTAARPDGRERAPLATPADAAARRGCTMGASPRERPPPPPPPP